MARPAASQAIRAANVWIAEHVGIRTLKMYLTANIKKFTASHVKKAISPKQSTDRGGRAPYNISDEPQASSHKSVKPQA